MRIFGQRLTTYLVAVLWIAPPVVVSVILTQQEREVDLVAPVQVWVPVDASLEPGTRAVSLALTWSQSPAVVAPAWTGVVQEVMISDDGLLRSGQTLVTIDGLQRVLAATPGPFYRPLSLGNTGIDAGWLNALLASRDLPHDTGNKITARTVRGIAAFARELGLPRTPEQTVFDPTWVIFLPAEIVPADSINLTVGTPAPSAGTVISTPVRQLVGAELVVAGSVSTEPITDGAAGDTSDVGSSSPEDGSTDSLPGSSGSPSGDTLTQVIASPEETLQAGEVALTLNSERSGISVDDLAAVAAIVTVGQPGVDAVLSAPAMQGEVSVPAAAVFSGSDGQTCVLTDGPAGRRVASVEVRGELMGNTILVGELEPPDRVLLAPPAVDRKCL